MLQMRLLLPFLLHLATLEVSGGDAGGVAQRCMKKVVMLEEVVFDERTECHHVMQESCFQVHQPDFKKQEVKKCGDSFKKSCTLEYDRVPRRIRTRVCRDAVTTVCSKEEEGKEEEEEEEICSVVYETVCETAFLDDEDEDICQDEDDACVVSQDDDGSDDSGGLRRVPKTLGAVNCSVEQREVCRRPSCRLTTERSCAEEPREVILEVPREECRLVPRKSCRTTTRLLPSLKLVTECVRVPKEVCGTSRVSPRKVRRPVVRRWCADEQAGQTDPYSKLVIVGGFNGSVWHRDIRVLDLTLMDEGRNGGRGRSRGGGGECARLPDIPVRGLNSGGVSAFVGGRALICGGATIACFVLEDVDGDGDGGNRRRWVRAKHNMPAVRIFPTTITMRNHTEWWITGGRSSSRGNLDSTIVLTAGEDAFQVMPSLRLPLPLRGHSLVQLNGTHLFLHGGFVPPDRNLRRAWTMDLREGRWREQRPSAVGRRKAFAGLVNIDDEQFVLVSGGFAPAPLSSSELFSLRTLTWSPGPPLPHPRAGGASVPRPADGSMLVVGGSLEREESARRVLRFDPLRVGWEETKLVLWEALYHFNAFLVPSDFVSCSNAD